MLCAIQLQHLHAMCQSEGVMLMTHVHLLDYSSFATVLQMKSQQPWANHEGLMQAQWLQPDLLKPWSSGTQMLSKLRQLWEPAIQG